MALLAKGKGEVKRERANLTRSRQARANRHAVVDPNEAFYSPRPADLARTIASARLLTCSLPKMLEM